MAQYNRSNRINRRRFIQAVGATSATTSLAGCTGGSNGGDGTVQITVLEDGYPTEEDREEFKQALRDQDIPDDIELEILTMGLDTIDDQYRQWLNSGRSEPDILTMDVGWSIPFIERGQLINLNEHLEDNVIDELESHFNGPSLDSSRDPDGNLYGVPSNMDIRGMLYRKDLAEEAGYDPEGENWATEPMSWAEWSQVVADAMEESDDLEYGLTLALELSQTITCCVFNGIMSQWGGAYFGGRDNLFGPIGDRPVTVDEEPVHDALRMLRTFLYGHDDEHSLDSSEFAGEIVPEGALGWRFTVDMESFINGEAFAYDSGVPLLIQMAASEDNFGGDVHDRVGLMPYPYGVEESESAYDGIGGSVSELAGYNYSINQNTEMLEESLEIIKAMTTDEFQAFQFNATGNIPPKTPVLESDEVQDHSFFGDYMDTYEVAAENPIPRPVTSIYFQQSDVIAQEVHNVLSQDKSPEEGMEDLEEQLLTIENDNAQ